MQYGLYMVLGRTSKMKNRVGTYQVSTTTMLTKEIGNYSTSRHLLGLAQYTFLWELTPGPNFY